MRRFLASALVLAATTGPVAAHNPLPGIEGFYAGLLHPFSTPDQILALLAAGLLLGSFALRRLPAAFAAFALGLGAGAALGDPQASPVPWLYGTAACAAAVAALTPGRALPLAILLTLIAGGLFGWASLPEPGPPRDRLFTASGAITGAALGLLYLAGGVDLLRERVDVPWLGIALRVAAAWVAAIAILMLALHFAPAQA